MAFRLELRTVVYNDIRSAATWYNAESAGLGKRFVLAVYETFDSITIAPNNYRKINLEVRRVKVKMFPYLILFIVAESSIVVLGVIHNKRGPRFIKNRLA
jgi:plasmid stabilization system protein ParE